MKSNYEISVIIPVYNGELFIEDCISCILNQSIFEKLEVIIVDDASTDNTFNVVTELTSKYDNIKVYRNKENLRQGGARNIGINQSSCTYIGFIDADDMVVPNYFEVLYKLIRDNDSDAAYVGYKSIPEDYHFADVTSNNRLNDIVVMDFSKDCRENFLISEIGPIWSGIYKKDVIINNNIWFPVKHRFEDNYWVSLLKCYFGRVSVSRNYCGYLYRNNSHSTTHLYDTYELIDERLEIERAILKELLDRNIYAQYKDAFDYLFIKRFAFGTFISYLRMFTILPYGRIHSLKEEFARTFPRWKENKYLKESKKTIRIISWLFDLDDEALSTKALYRNIWLMYQLRRLLRYRN